jgi:hypothetical protein
MIAVSGPTANPNALLRRSRQLLMRSAVLAAIALAPVAATAQSKATCSTYNAGNEPSATFRGGDKIIIRGSGFGPGSPVLVSLQQETRNIEIGRPSANDLGAFTLGDAVVPETVIDGKAAIRALDARGSATCAVTLRAGAGAEKGGLNGLFVVWGLLLAAFAVLLGILTYRRWKAERLREAFDRLAWRDQFDVRTPQRAGPQSREAFREASEPGPVFTSRAPDDAASALSSHGEKVSHEDFLARLQPAGRAYGSMSNQEPARFSLDEIDEIDEPSPFAADAEPVEPEPVEPEPILFDEEEPAYFSRAWLEFEEDDAEPTPALERPSHEALERPSREALEPPSREELEPPAEAELSAAPVPGRPATPEHAETESEWEPPLLAIPIERGPSDEEFFEPEADPWSAFRPEADAPELSPEPARETTRDDDRSASTAPVADVEWERAPAPAPGSPMPSNEARPARGRPRLRPPRRAEETPDAVPGKPLPTPPLERENAQSSPPRLPVGWDGGRLRARRHASDAIERLRREVRFWKR